MRARLARLARRPLVITALAVVVLAAGGGAYLLVSDNHAKATPSYRLVAASVGTIKQSLTSTGTIEPAVQDSLNFAVSGQVTSVRVAEGDHVKAGQVLATVDSAELTANVAQAKAALAGDQARLTSDQDAGASSTQVAADQAAVTTANDQASAAQSALSDATLSSPIDGVVATVDLTVGQRVSGSSGSGGSGGSGSGSGGSGSGSGAGGGSGSSGGSGGSSGSSDGSGSASSSTTQFLVISTDSWVVDASVDSSGIGLIAKGNQAEIVPGAGGSTGGAGAGGRAFGRTGTQSSGGTGSTVYGTISSIGLIASSSSGTASFPVTVNVTGNPGGLHAGDTASVSLIYRQYSNVLTVPSLAISQVNGKSVVYELAHGKKTAHPVTTGVSSGGLTQITAGLSEGDQVVVDLPKAVTGGGAGNGTRTGGTFPRGGFPGIQGGIPGGAVVIPKGVN